MTETKISSGARFGIGGRSSNLFGDKQFILGGDAFVRFGVSKLISLDVGLGGRSTLPGGSTQDPENTGGGLRLIDAAEYGRLRLDPGFTFKPSPDTYDPVAPEKVDLTDPTSVRTHLGQIDIPIRVNFHIADNKLLLYFLTGVNFHHVETRTGETSGVATYAPLNQGNKRCEAVAAGLPVGREEFCKPAEETPLLPINFSKPGGDTAEWSVGYQLGAGLVYKPIPYIGVFLDFAFQGIPGLRNQAGDNAYNLDFMGGVVGQFSDEAEDKPASIDELKAIKDTVPQGSTTEMAQYFMKANKPGKVSYEIFDKDNKSVVSSKDVGSVDKDNFTKTIQFGPGSLPGGKYTVKFTFDPGDGKTPVDDTAELVVTAPPKFAATGPTAPVGSGKDDKAVFQVSVTDRGYPEWNDKISLSLTKPDATVVDYGNVDSTRNPFPISTDGFAPGRYTLKIGLVGTEQATPVPFEVTATKLIVTASHKSIRRGENLRLFITVDKDNAEGDWRLKGEATGTTFTTGTKDTALTINLKAADTMKLKLGSQTFVVKLRDGTTETAVVQVNEFSVNLKGTTFKSGSNQLSKDRDMLDSLAEAARAVEAFLENTDRCVVIEGYTDNVGDPTKTNLPLSWRRANTIRKYVLDRLTKAQRAAWEERIVIVGYGQENPTADNGSDAGRAANRRVELKPLTPADAATLRDEHPEPAYLKQRGGPPQLPASGNTNKRPKPVRVKLPGSGS